MTTWKAKLLGKTCSKLLPRGGIPVLIQRIDTYASFGTPLDIDITLASGEWSEEHVHYSAVMGAENVGEIRILNHYPLLKLFKARGVIATLTATTYQGEIDGELATLLVPFGDIGYTAMLYSGIRQ